jgi:hypothetical protein
LARDGQGKVRVDGQRVVERLFGQGRPLPDELGVAEAAVGVGALLVLVDEALAEILGRLVIALADIDEALAPLGLFAPFRGGHGLGIELEGLAPFSRVESLLGLGQDLFTTLLPGRCRNGKKQDDGGQRRSKSCRHGFLPVGMSKLDLPTY